MTRWFDLRTSYPQRFEGHLPAASLLVLTLPRAVIIVRIPAMDRGVGTVPPGVGTLGFADIARAGTPCTALWTDRLQIGV
ncbi:MAG: hypothetical protein BRD26_00125 [Bacteroidetes bacterium QH_1_64_81]|nr:MAG: hypothetical protein BRD26_00125 [Bacteroidetes bacterium QH_1_64_81]